MADEKVSVVDPQTVQETLCEGPLNILLAGGGRAVLTFTHSRPKMGPLFEESRVETENVVRARIVLTVASLIQLRDTLNKLLPQNEPTAALAAAAGTATIH
jgi:hypothetical protein